MPETETSTFVVAEQEDPNAIAAMVLIASILRQNGGVAILTNTEMERSAAAGVKISSTEDAMILQLVEGE